MNKVRKYCADCVWATLIYPEDAPKFFQCGNPRFVVVNVVDKSKRYRTCEELRLAPSDVNCGASAVGFLAIVPDFKKPVISRCERLAVEIRHIWQQRGYLSRLSDWHWMSKSLSGFWARVFR